MKIVDAKPAPRYINIPTSVLDACLELGKGHLDTMMRIMRYLWSDEPLEGTSEEFSTALGIHVRTWQRHVVDLGRNGCLLYSQPHRGLHVLVGIPRDAEQVHTLAAIWERLSAERSKRKLSGWQIPGAALALYQAEAFLPQADVFLPDETTKLSFPVVVSSSTMSLNSKNPLKEEKQQQTSSNMVHGGARTEDETTKLSFADDETTKLSLETTKLSFAQQKARSALRNIGVAPSVCDALASEEEPEWIASVIQAATAKAENGEIRNLAGWVVHVIKNGETVDIPLTWSQVQDARQDMPVVAEPEPQPLPRRAEEGAQIWEAALAELEGAVAGPTFDTWLRGTRCLGIEGANGDTCVVVAVKNGYAVEWLAHRLYTRIQRALGQVTGEHMQARFVVWDEAAWQAAPPALMEVEQ